MILLLPWPPSENRYRRTVGYMPIISKEGRTYKNAVKTMIRVQNIPKLDGPVSVSLFLSPPDRKKRDLDNTLKALFDAISDEIVKRKNKDDTVIPGIVHDDSQIVCYEKVRWLNPSSGGCVILDINPVGDKRESLETVLDMIKKNGLNIFRFQ